MKLLPRVLRKPRWLAYDMRWSYSTGQVLCCRHHAGTNGGIKIGHQESPEKYEDLHAIYRSNSDQRSLGGVQHLGKDGKWYDGPAQLCFSLGTDAQINALTSQPVPHTFADARSAENKAWRLANHIPDWWVLGAGVLIAGQIVATIVAAFIARGGC